MSYPRMVLRCLALLFALTVMSLDQPAFAQSALRIGVIDAADGSMVKGAQLAARQINDEGGIVAADGVAFSLTIVHTPPDNMEIAIANMGQASVVAVIGPARDELVTRYMTQLQALDVPVITPATGDTVLLQDNSNRIFRSRARGSVTTAALSDYLVNALGIRSIRTVQLDRASTVALITLANALSPFGVSLSNTLVNEIELDADAIARDIIESDPDLVAIYGPPLASAQVYNRLRAAGYSSALVYDQADDPAFSNIVPANDLLGIIAADTWSPSLRDAASEAFVLDYARAFGQLPDALAAASFDATRAVAASITGFGSLGENLAVLSHFQGVQGELNPADLVRGELSSNAVVTRLNERGTANVVARYRGGRRISEGAPLVAWESPTPAPIPTLAPTSTPSGHTLVVQSPVQNVRSGPGLQFDVIGQLPSGTQARVLGATPDYAWLVIDFQGQWGWLASYLVETFGNHALLPVIQPPASPTPAPTSTAAPSRDPDLVVLRVEPPRIILDQPVTVSVTIRNQGLTAAGPFAIATSFQPGDRYAGLNSAGLDTGEQTTLQLSQILSGATGPQSVIIVVDLNEQVPEGAAGEANNRVYAYSYIADRAILASGTTTIGVGNIDLDGFGYPDLAWTGADLIALGEAGMYLLNDVSSIGHVHYDAVDTSLATLTSLPLALLNGAVLGLRTADGHHAVLQPINATRDGTITFDYRVYR